MRGMRGSRGSYTPRGGGVATSQQAASGLVISNVSNHEEHDHMKNMITMVMMTMMIMEALLQATSWSWYF